MPQLEVGEWAGLLTAIAALIGTFVTWMYNKRKVANEGVHGAAAVVESALTLIEPLRERIEVLEQQHKEMQAQLDANEERMAKDEAKIADFIEGIERLQNQIRSLGHIPVWPLA